MVWLKTPRFIVEVWPNIPEFAADVLPRKSGFYIHVWHKPLYLLSSFD